MEQETYKIPEGMSLKEIAMEIPTLSPHLYNCPVCNNRGYRVFKDNQGKIKTITCKCIKTRKNIRSLWKSGLGESIDRFTMQTWKTEERWHHILFQKANNFISDPRGWFFIGGDPATGKTHICSAICLALIEQGKDTQYLMWRDDSPRAKGSVNDAEEYQQLVQPWKDAQVLYIDDLFKAGRVNGQKIDPTPADINLAYEILNRRYMSPSKITIISSEFTLKEIIRIDAAVGGRIAEMAGGHVYSTQGMKDWRLAHAGTPRR